MSSLRKKGWKQLCQDAETDTTLEPVIAAQKSGIDEMAFAAEELEEVLQRMLQRANDEKAD